jgi:hypothetical protein
MGLEPNINSTLNGTSFRYILRDTAYQVTLNQGAYALSGNGFSVCATNSFGLANTQTGLRYFHLNEDSCTLEIKKTSVKQQIDLTILYWDEEQLSFRLHIKGLVQITVNGLTPDSYYTATTGQTAKRLKTTAEGRLIVSSVNPQQVAMIIKKDTGDL